MKRLSLTVAALALIQYGQVVEHCGDMRVVAAQRKCPRAAHPSVWAPFIVVGEGGAAR